MRRTFQDLVNRLIQERGIVILENGTLCKALLQDYAKGVFKREIRLFLQSLEAGYHRKLLKAVEPELTKQALIREFQDDYGIAREIAEETIAILAAGIEKHTETDEEQIARLEKIAPQGDYRTKYTLGRLLQKLKRYEAAADWFEKSAEQCMALYEHLVQTMKTCPRYDPGPNRNKIGNTRENLTEFVRIEGGTFMMGSPETEPERSADETLHPVKVKGFFLGRYEVTQREYEAVMGTNPSEFKGTDLPVEKVSWFDAVAYCNARSIREGLVPAYHIKGEQVSWNREATGYRLPTEAEWEYACRAGTVTPFNTGNNITTDQANYDGQYPYNKNPKGIGRQRTTGAGSFPPNPWGLYDMHGNVLEWCWDWYWAYDTRQQQDPSGSYWGTKRVIRGGSWNGDGRTLRSAYRGDSLPAYRAGYLGFRILCTSLLCVLGRL
jgi:formylglycine-generating enzyme required for sulfatase activity